MHCKLALDTPADAPASGTRLVSWCPPPRDFFKVNVVFSLGNPGLAGFGAIFRGRSGNWIVGFSCHIGTSTNMLAELMAIRFGLSEAWQRGFRLVILESDSLEAVSFN
ncbi:hypothetical protein P3X46_009781 [Hevea brasiliensis]|uniref:RNase H type-1 domain-containing protein n=1 Tax=Hevea brasiliensis TaxID=3981 RepID=A0ABQ9MQG0_HEVBR|nr:hypothetical protein P3X46_009781 [Hevea brasiliensis]